MDVLRVLTHFNINYVSDHPKVSAGAVGICCPLCGETNFKRGIFLDNGISFCWKCGNSMTLYKLLHTLKGISYDEFCEVANIPKYSDSTKSTLDNIFAKDKPVKKEKKSFNIGEYDKYFRWDFSSPLIEKFLKERNFEKDLLYQYNCQYAIAGDYQQRLILPVYDNIKILSFAAYDLTHTSKSKYLFPKDSNIHDYLYKAGSPAYDNDTIVLVEGVFDAWAVGLYKPAYALFGKIIHPAQVTFLINNTKITNRILILLDGDATLQDSYKIKCQLAPYFKTIDTYILIAGYDPCSCPRELLKKLLTEGEGNVAGGIGYSEESII